MSRFMDDIIKAFNNSLLPFAFCLLLSAYCLLPSAVRAQTIADKTVASVTNGARATPDLITYSDLVWQLALEPKRPFTERRSSEELNQALRTLEDQTLILQEARKLPLPQTDEARKKFEEDVRKKRDELALDLGSRATLEERMGRVGLTSAQLDAILRDRVTEEQYIEFRFRAFVVVSLKEITDRYNQQYGPLRNRDRIVQTLDQVHDQIEHDLAEEKIAAAIDTFVDNLRDQPGTEIVILSPV